MIAFSVTKREKTENGDASGKAQVSRLPVSKNDPRAFKSGDVEWRCVCVSRALHYPLSVQIGVYRNLPIFYSRTASTTPMVFTTFKKNEKDLIIITLTSSRHFSKSALER